MEEQPGEATISKQNTFMSLDMATNLQSSFHIPGHKYLCLLKIVGSVGIVYHVCEKLYFSWKYCKESHT